jgi:Zn-dependent protease with chaperone function
MNFFEHQMAARRQTTLLITYYALAVILIIASIYTVTALVFLQPSEPLPDNTLQLHQLWDPSLFLAVSGILLAIIGGGTLFKIMSLSSGGEAVARMLDGRPVLPSTTDLAEKRLLNIVEEISIASGTQIPKVFVLDNELGINAFAAGISPSNAVIAVTRGALEHFNRDEMQSVIGHEFSHILNGDMRLNLRLIGVLNGILIIALLGYWMFRITAYSSHRRSSSDKKGGGAVAAIVILGLATMIIGYIGVFFARLIKSAVSRQREFLADASAVQFTRNPLGLSSALKKIGAYSSGSRIQNKHAEQASHLFFSNGVGFSLMGLLATHPPLDERIRRIDSTFAGTFDTPAAPESGTDNLLGLSSSITPPPLPSPAVTHAVTPQSVVANVGTLQTAALEYATSLLAAMPPELLQAVRQPNGAQAVVYGLAMNLEQPSFRNGQLDHLSTHAAPAVHRETLALATPLSALRPELRLPVAELAIATLRHLSTTQCREFKDNLLYIASTDNEISLFEYAVIRMVLRNLESMHGLNKRPLVRFTSLSDLVHECTVLLSVVAWFGTNDKSGAEVAFNRGFHRLGLTPIGALLPQARASLKELDTALDRLAEATPTLKENIIAAVVDTITTDSLITKDEGEVLRAIADALDCPTPPFLPGQSI